MIKHLKTGPTAVVVLAALISLTTPGCSMFSCDNYMSYDDLLDSWMGANLSEYERKNDRRPVSTMERPRNVMEYAFDTPYVNYDGSRQSCRTWFDVDRASGEIIGWRYEGDCYLHGRCAG